MCYVSPPRRNGTTRESKMRASSPQKTPDEMEKQRELDRAARQKRYEKLHKYD
ncbi:MAG: hypothetical protein Q8P23_03240 [bacterium]|nr:hypothetical protein [bacterium]